MDELLKEVEAFENMKMSHMTTSDRVKATREGKRLVLALHAIYKENNNDPEIMVIMKRVTEKKKKIEKRLLGLPPEARE